MKQVPVAKKMRKALQALYGKREDLDTMVTDALADLRHMCDVHSIDFYNCDRIAYSHYVVELKDKEQLKQKNAVETHELSSAEAKHKLQEKIEERLSFHIEASGENPGVLPASCLYVSPIRVDVPTFTVEEFRELCENESFSDEDGWGHPAKDNKQDRSIRIFSSRLGRIPSDATHIVWYDR